MTAIFAMLLISCRQSGQEQTNTPAPTIAASTATPDTPAELIGTCPADRIIWRSFPNQAAWQLCWDWDYHTGIVLSDIRYTLPSGTQRLVLKEAAPAELHVTYDNGSTFYLDVSKEGLGFNMEALTMADCPTGRLHDYEVAEGDVRPVLCEQTHSHGYASKRVQDIRYGTSLDLFSVSKIDAYEYVYLWSFHDDGEIEVQVGSTGQLNEYGLGAEDYGWQVYPTPEVGRPEIALSHVHTFWFRLDFDIDGPANDVVEEFNFYPEENQRRQRMEISELSQEIARTVEPSTFRFWRIKDTQTMNADGHAISYRIEPTTQAIYRSLTEWPWTEYDFYVTAYRPCERWLVNNSAENCASSILEYVDGESIHNRDLVVWYGTSFHHVPRDEDQNIMPIHWDGFHLIPHDWSAINESVVD